MKSRLLLLVLLAAAVPATAAQVYSWTDANGVKHFSDSPPPPSVTNAQKIKVRGGVTSEDGAVVADASSKPATTPPTPANGTNTTADSPEARARNCQAARANLELLQSNFQVSAPPGDDGKSQVLDAAGRKEAVAKAADQVSFYCR